MFLLNFFRCLFCRRTSCSTRFAIGTRRYYNCYWLSVKSECPKDYPFYDFKTTKEIREEILKEIDNEAEEEV